MADDRRQAAVAYRGHGMSGAAASDEKTASSLTRAADALAREPALMRVVEAAKALDFYGPGEGREIALSAALRALDEVGS